MEPPECPVCLQPYDSVATIPRVLACGHSTCQSCLSELPKTFTDTIRCPSCTQLVKFPKHPSSLPKNIDLLRLSSLLQDEKATNQIPPHKERIELQTPFIPNLWTHEFYKTWKKWVLPRDTLLVDSEGAVPSYSSLLCGSIVKCCDDQSLVGCAMKENDKVGLVKIGIFLDGSSKFKYNYEAKIIGVLYGMRDGERKDLGLVLDASLRIYRVSKVYGFWLNETDHCVYMVCGRFNANIMKEIEGFSEGLAGKKGEDRFGKMAGIGMIAASMCEAVSSLHSDGLLIGLLGVSCFSFDEFGFAYVDFSQVIVLGRKISSVVAEAILAKGKIDGEHLDNYFQDNPVFISPEVFLRLTKKGGQFELASSRYEVGMGSEVWSLASIMIWVLIGQQFVKQMYNYLHIFLTKVSDKEHFDYKELYIGWTNRIIDLLEGIIGSEFPSLKEVLHKCLDFDPACRPTMNDLRKCFRGLIIKREFDLHFNIRQEVRRERIAHCLVSGELCEVVKETDNLQEKDDNGSTDAGKSWKMGTDKDVIEGISQGQFKSVDLKGHLDCITGLAVGGSFLFSSSFDKTVQVWSLQDFTHVHSFKDHEYKVMAVVFVNDEQPLCISGDNGGVICIWEASAPFGQAPLKRMYEQKDWRYSGIHALAVSGNEYLYTGSGDKSVKAWSLKDYSLSCTMTGHKSVVSSLAVCNGVLYSGSWDGTVRLWCLSDHSPLAVLGEDSPVSVLSLAADESVLVVTYESGCTKIWCNDVLVKSANVHLGAVFSVSKKGKWLFTGGWDKSINMQELCGDGPELDLVAVGSITGDSVVTALVYWQGKLLVGQGDRTIKVYYFDG